MEKEKKRRGGGDGGGGRLRERSILSIKQKLQATITVLVYKK